MSKLLEQLEQALDLSYLEKWEFPETTYKTIGILGGGTAGYLTALALKKCHPQIETTILESSLIPVIGVGESTTTEILPFLHQLLEFDPIEFFQQVQPTLKLGIQFDWGKKGENPFNFNFFASHHHESYYFEKHIENSNWPSCLMNHGKIPIIKTESDQILSLLNEIPFSYHLDNQKFVQYLKTKVLQSGIKIIDTEIVNSPLNDQGFIRQLTDRNGTSYEYDLYIDCSGFRSKLLGEALKTPFQSFSSTLVTDRALTFSLPNNEVINCFTSAITMNNGWCWKIPMRQSDHYGYVYSSQYCSDEEALLEVKKRWGQATDYKIIPFRSGRHEKAWNKNVFALGNSFAFIEPLESTAIQTLVHSIMLLCRLMPQSQYDTGSINSLNKEIAANWDTFRWFLGAHYKFNEKLDTPFWLWCRENVDLGDAKEICQLFQLKAPLSKGHFGTTTGFTAYTPFVFNSYSYDSLLFGQRQTASQLPKPAMTENEYQQKVKSYEDLTQVSLTQNQLFNNESLLYENILPDLFNDTDSWIFNTPI